MLEGIKHSIKDSAARTARKTALGLAAGLFLTVGVGFLTVAAWLVLVPLTSTATAALIIGCTYAGLGFIFLMAAMLGGSPSQASHPEQAVSSEAADATNMIAAFMTGLKAGQSTRPGRG